MSEKFLEINNVTKIYRIGGLIGSTKLAAVDQVTLSLEKGRPQILSLVGDEDPLSRKVKKALRELEG